MTVDSRSLFTNGAFVSDTNPDRPLALYTNGAFPRLVAVAPVEEVPRSAGQDDRATVGTGRRRRVIYPEIVDPNRDEAAILAAIMFAEMEDEDWINWF